MIHSSKRDTSPITLRLSLAPLTLATPVIDGGAGRNSFAREKMCLSTLIGPKWINLVNFEAAAPAS